MRTYLLCAAAGIALGACTGDLQGNPGEPDGGVIPPTADADPTLPDADPTLPDADPTLPDADPARPDANQPPGPDANLAGMCDEQPPPGPARTIPAISDPRTAKAIYDDYFERFLPQHDDMGWQDAPWITADWVNGHHFPTPPAGLGLEQYHQYFDLNPYNFDRPGLAAFDSDNDNDALWASGASAEEIYRTYDPTEWMPAVSTVYTRTSTSDIMASQLYYRLMTPELRTKMVTALELCPDCDDVYTPLTHDELYKIIELRFVRYVSGAPQVSRVFKLIGVDSSGAIESHLRNDDWSFFGTIGGQTARAKWRQELSGAIAQRYWNTTDSTYVRLMPVLIRTSRTAVLHQYYDGRFDRDTGGAGDPYERIYNPAAAGECLRDCHAEKCQEGMDVEGMAYWMTSDCKCHRDYTTFTAPLPADTYATGVCESWTAGDYWEYPSSYACE